MKPLTLHTLATWGMCLVNWHIWREFTQFSGTYEPEVRKQYQGTNNIWTNHGKKWISTAREKKPRHPVTQSHGTPFMRGEKPRHPVTHYVCKNKQKPQYMKKPRLALPSCVDVDVDSTTVGTLWILKARLLILSNPDHRITATLLRQRGPKVTHKNCYTLSSRTTQRSSRSHALAGTTEVSPQQRDAAVKQSNYTPRTSSALPLPWREDWLSCISVLPSPTTASAQAGLGRLFGQFIQLGIADMYCNLCLF